MVDTFIGLTSALTCIFFWICASQIWDREWKRIVILIEWGHVLFDQFPRQKAFWKLANWTRQDLHRLERRRTTHLRTSVAVTAAPPSTARPLDSKQIFLFPIPPFNSLQNSEINDMSKSGIAAAVAALSDGVPGIILSWFGSCGAHTV